MREIIQRRFILLAVCLLLGLSSRSVIAAERTDIARIAYVDTAQRGLVLSFNGFSESGIYTYEIATGGSVIAEGTASPSMTYPLQDQYKENTPYLLIITSQEGDTLSVHYYTGRTINGFRVSQTDHNITLNYSVNKKASVSGYLAQVCQRGTAAPLVEKIINKGKSPATISASSLQSGDYDVRFIACRKIDGTIYYGEGFTAGLTYVRPPSKVTSIKATPNTKRVELAWSASAGASGYRILQSATSSGKFKPVADNITETSAVINGLKPGKKYYFKIEPVATFGSKTVKGPQSAAKGATVPVVAGKVKGVKAYVNEAGQMFLKWKKTKNAYGYHVYYRKAADPDFTKLEGTTKTKILLNNITENTDYEFVVYAVTKKGINQYVSDAPSKVLKMNPVRDAYKLLANKVRTIGFVGRKKEIYTTKKYSSAVKLAFVNSKGKKYGSPTKYLIWISHYTQQVTIFEGEAGNWNIIRSFNVATGRANTRSPRGVFRIGKKEKGWYYNSTKCLYVTHYHGENAFHTRPLYKSGGVATSTLGKPASHGCVRCKNHDAKFIYTSMPKGTTVVSY
jgi:hypothetical protein